MIGHHGLVNMSNFFDKLFEDDVTVTSGVLVCISTVRKKIFVSSVKLYTYFISCCIRHDSDVKIYSIKPIYSCFPFRYLIVCGNINIICCFNFSERVVGLRGDGEFAESILNNGGSVRYCMTTE